MKVPLSKNQFIVAGIRDGVVTLNSFDHQSFDLPVCFLTAASVGLIEVPVPVPVPASVGVGHQACGSGDPDERAEFVEGGHNAEAEGEGQDQAGAEGEGEADEEEALQAKPFLEIGSVVEISIKHHVGLELQREEEVEQLQDEIGDFI